MNKEQIYDEKISPLVQQLSAVCEAHGIEVLVNVFVPIEGNPSLQVTTSLPDENGNKTVEHLLAFITLCHDRDMGQFMQQGVGANAIQ